MTDKFIDDLHHELQQNDRGGSRARHRRQQFDEAAQRWWAEFIDVLGQKVGAWNEKGGSGAPVNFTKRQTAGAHVYHKAAELELRLEDHRVLTKTRLGSGTLTDGPLIELEDAGDGRVRAQSDGEPLESPMVAAEKVIAPILTQVFRQR